MLSVICAGESPPCGDVIGASCGPDALLTEKSVVKVSNFTFIKYGGFGLGSREFYKSAVISRFRGFISKD